MTGYQTGLGNQLTNDGLWTYTYDNEGNLIKKSKGSSLETWQYGYDNLNHLVWAKDEPTDGGSPTLIATYIYDVFGNRLEKDVWTSAGGTVVSRFGYDADKVWSDLNGSNQLVTRYLEGEQAGPPLARKSAAGVAGWYLADHLGSVRNLTDNSGTLIDTIAYDAYGNVNKETSPSNGDRYKWATLQIDNETGLYHAWARDELPPVGRWLQQDPLGFSAGDTDLYRYLQNSPTIATDPTGLSDELFKAEIGPLQLQEPPSPLSAEYDNVLYNKFIKYFAKRLVNAMKEAALKKEIELDLNNTYGKGSGNSATRYSAGQFEIEILMLEDKKLKDMHLADIKSKVKSWEQEFEKAGYKIIAIALPIYLDYWVLQPQTIPRSGVVEYKITAYVVFQAIDPNGHEVYLHPVVGKTGIERTEYGFIANAPLFQPNPNGKDKKHKPFWRPWDTHWDNPWER